MVTITDGIIEFREEILFGFDFLDNGLKHLNGLFCINHVNHPF